MAIPREPAYTPYSGIVVASPSSPHGSHTFRSAANFDKIVTGLEQLVIDHSNLIGDIAYIKEWWEDPAVVGEGEEFPCFYILPLFIAAPRSSALYKADEDKLYNAKPYIGDPLAKGVYPITVMAYYKYLDVRTPITDVRNWAWNYWDILMQDKVVYALPGGIQAMTPRIGWHISSTNYIILWWSLQLQVTAIL